MWRLRETAERAPIASTPVASRSPVVQFGFVVLSCRTEPRAARRLDAFDVDDALELCDSAHELPQPVDVTDSEVEHILCASVLRKARRFVDADAIGGEYGRHGSEDARAVVGHDAKRNRQIDVDIVAPANLNPALGIEL